jgi:hypothetical protein
MGGKLLQFSLPRSLLVLFDEKNPSAEEFVFFSGPLSPLPASPDTMLSAATYSDLDSIIVGISSVLRQKFVAEFAIVKAELPKPR